jgi:hypothetical protein
MKYLYLSIESLTFLLKKFIIISLIGENFMKSFGSSINVLLGTILIGAILYNILNVVFSTQDIITNNVSNEKMNSYFSFNKIDAPDGEERSSLLTILGEDKNKNNIRDDVERITLYYYHDSKDYKSLYDKLSQKIAVLNGMVVPNKDTTDNSGSAKKYYKQQISVLKQFACVGYSFNRDRIKFRDKYSHDHLLNSNSDNAIFAKTIRKIINTDKRSQQLGNVLVSWENLHINFIKAYKDYTGNDTAYVEKYDYGFRKKECKSEGIL